MIRQVFETVFSSGPDHFKGKKGSVSEEILHELCAGNFRRWQKNAADTKPRGTCRLLLSVSSSAAWLRAALADVRSFRRGNPMNRKRIGIIIFDDTEVLDFCGPFEIFSAARLNEERRREGPSSYEVLNVEITVNRGAAAVLPGPRAGAGHISKPTGANQ